MIAKLVWYGHVARMDPDRIVNKIMETEKARKSNKTRPRKTLMKRREKE